MGSFILSLSLFHPVSLSFFLSFFLSSFLSHLSLFHYLSVSIILSLILVVEKNPSYSVFRVFVYPLQLKESISPGTRRNLSPLILSSMFNSWKCLIFDTIMVKNQASY